MGNYPPLVSHKHPAGSRHTAVTNSAATPDNYANYNALIIPLYY